MHNNIGKLLVRSLVLGSMAVSMMMPLAAHADYGGQSPITKHGVFVQLETKGILTREPQLMEEAYTGHLSTKVDDRSRGLAFEAADLAHGYRTPDERVQQSAGGTTISGSPATLTTEPPWTGRQH